MNSHSIPKLYLIPVPLSDVPHERCLPEYNCRIIASLKHFIVENVRTARRFLRVACPDLVIDTLTFYELNKHTEPEALSSYLDPLTQGESVGLLSEAGCPAIADPGSDVVAMAHRRGFAVDPLIGPSSILLSLMASGLNGQRFAFLGYLPIDDSDRTRAIRDAEHRALSLGETQIFIETPYRNERLVSELIRHCRPSTRLCIASRLTDPDAMIVTRTLAQWRGHEPQLHKQPTIFLLGK